jgi:hypothetical protein
MVQSEFSVAFDRSFRIQVAIGSILHEAGEIRLADVVKRVRLECPELNSERANLAESVEQALIEVGVLKAANARGSGHTAQAEYAGAGFV